MPHLCLHKGAGIKKTHRCGSSARLVFGYKCVFLVLSPQAKNPGMSAALREQRTACHWVQGRVFGSFAAGEKSRNERSAA
jgi:hypothetical protein